MCLQFNLGPLELTRRSKVLVWDDEIEVAEQDLEERAEISPRASISSVPLPRRRRSSSGGEFPPPIHRTSTDSSGVRPVPFAAKFKRVHPATKGIDVLEHLERLDAVEASLQRLGVEDYDDDEEVDVGESSTKPIQVPGSSSSARATSPFSPPASPPLPTVPEVPSLANSDGEEEDVAMLSKSLSHVEGHQRWASQATPGHGHGVEWISSGEAAAKRTVIVERLESITKKPLCTCW